MIEALGQLFLLAIGIGAVWRLALLVTHDDGPGDWLLIVRTWLGAYDYGADGRPRSQVGRVVSCIHCASVWLALPVALVLWWGDWGLVLLGLFALSGWAIVLSEVTKEE